MGRAYVFDTSQIMSYQASYSSYLSTISFARAHVLTISLGTIKAYSDYSVAASYLPSSNTPPDPHSMEPNTVVLPDGRVLEYIASGPQNGLTLVFIHGTPGSASPNPAMVDACSRKGLRLLTVSRAGYGGSSRKPGRAAVDMAADVRSLLDHLGVDKCVVGGWSGGGTGLATTANQTPTTLPRLTFRARRLFVR